MAFSSKYTIYCQADPQNCPKMDSSGAALAQIACEHDCRLLQKHSKVKIGSWARNIKTGVEFVNGILTQPQYFLPSWSPTLAKNEQFQGWFGPNDMCKSLQIAAKALQDQNWFISKVHNAWDGNCIWPFHPKTPFTAKSPPKIGQKWTIWELLWPKSHMGMIVDYCRSNPKSNLVHKEGL